MIATKHLSHMNEFEKNQRWLRVNLKRLLRKYKNMFVAVWNQQVIDKDKNIQKLSKRVRKEYKEQKGIIIEYLSPQPLEMIL